jgi:hypothetical protein
MSEDRLLQIGEKALIALRDSLAHPPFRLLKGQSIAQEAAQPEGEARQARDFSEAKRGHAQAVGRLCALARRGNRAPF